MTSEALTDILCASSATVIVSGTATSRTTASTGIGVAAAPLESSCRSCLRLPRGPRQPPAPPDVSPRVFSRRFFCCSSDQLEASLPDLISLTPGFLSSFFAPGLASVFAAGLCNVPTRRSFGRLRDFLRRAIIDLMAATSSSTTRLARCCASAACFATSSASFCARSALTNSSVASVWRACTAFRSFCSFCCASVRSRCARSAFSRAAAVCRVISSA